MAYGMTRPGFSLQWMAPLRAAAPIGAVLFLAACASTPTGGPAATTTAPVAAPPAAPQFTRDQVEGADPDDLAVLFDAPGLVRKEGDGEYRRYGLADCSLIVVLYPDDGGEMRVTHVEAAATRSDAPKPDVDACLARGR